jgi:protein gp37
MGVPQYQCVVDEKGWTGIYQQVLNVLDKPRSWKTPKRIFVDSMADLFVDDTGEYITQPWINLLWITMHDCPQHTFLILTKRPARAKIVIEQAMQDLNLTEPLPNVWVGVSAENQEYADLRIPLLLNIPATLRWISAEPLLGEINLTYIMLNGAVMTDALQGYRWKHEWPYYQSGCPQINWVVAGCESGPERRPADIEWFRRLRNQCNYTAVPFFLKQVEVGGKVVPMPLLDGYKRDQFPGKEWNELHPRNP